MTYQSQHLPQAPSLPAVQALPGLALLEFGAPWCPHCQKAQPLIAQALQAQPQAQHLKIEDGRGQPLGRHFGVKLWPTLIALFNGQEVARSVRPAEAQAIAQIMAQAHAGPGQLHYLAFDHSAGSDEGHNWDAMADLDGPHLIALYAEIARLLTWADQRFPGQRGPLEEGGQWDYELQASDASNASGSARPSLALRYDAENACLSPAPHPGQGRTRVTLSLSGTNAFAHALHQDWELED